MNSTKAVVVLVVAVTLLMVEVSARPASEDSHQQLTDGRHHRFMKNSCNNDRERRDRCELCAKQTKAMEVYNLCCSEDDKIAWCREFLAFGIGGY